MSKRHQQIPEHLRICFVARSFPWLARAADYGFLWPIARGLARRGHEVVVLAASNPQGLESVRHEQVQAYFVQEGPRKFSRRSFADLAYEKFAELHHQKPFHLLHSIDASALPISRRRKLFKIGTAFDVEATQMSELFALLGMAQETTQSLVLTGARVVYRFLSSFFGIDRSILKTADGVFVTSPQQRLALERYYLYPESRTYILPYGIELGDLRPKEKSDTLREHFGVPKQAQVVVTVSDMTNVPEAVNLLLAFERVAVKKPSTRLLFIGDGPRFKDIEREMLQLALGRHVIMTGDLKGTDIADAIALSDVFVNLSSRTSGFEPSLLEAMAQKKIIIGSEVSPMATIVEDGRDGFLIRPADVPGLAALLLQIFDGQIATVGVGENARQKILDIFDTNKMVDQTLRAYTSILERTDFYRSWSLF